MYRLLKTAHRDDSTGGIKYVYKLQERYKKFFGNGYGWKTSTRAFAVDSNGGFLYEDIEFNSKEAGLAYIKKISEQLPEDEYYYI